MSQKEEFHNLDNPVDGLLRELASGVSTRIFSGEQAMLSVVTLAPHAEGTLHHHPEEQWGVLLDGSAIRVQGGEEIAVKKGDFWRTPGNIPHTMRAGPDGARVLDIFSPPRPEYKKPGSGFGPGGRRKTVKGVSDCLVEGPMMSAEELKFAVGSVGNVSALLMRPEGARAC